MTSVGSHAADLRSAGRQLASARTRAAQGWEDQVRRSFETRILVPLEREASIAERALDELTSGMTRALSELR